MKKEAKLLLSKATDSLIVTIDHFNSTRNIGRDHVVLILMDHAFEMLLKSAIVEKRGKIREKGAKETIGFAKCINKCFSDAQVKFLTEEQKITLQTINAFRDAAQHYLLDVSERLLYMQTQAGVTVFKDIIKSVFNIDMYSLLPQRVLPLSTTPPTDLHEVFHDEVKEATRLLESGKRRKAEASSKIRALLIMENSLYDNTLQPTPVDINRISQKIVGGMSWEKIFPGVSAINMTQSGMGPYIDLRLTKKQGIPIHTVDENTTNGYSLAIRKVNEADYYSLGRNDIAKKLGITRPKTTALIYFLKIKHDENLFKEIRIGKSRHARYSPRTILAIQEAINNDHTIIDVAWHEHKYARQKT